MGPLSRQQPSDPGNRQLQQGERLGAVAGQYECHQGRHAHTHMCTHSEYTSPGKTTTKQSTVTSTTADADTRRHRARRSEGGMKTAPLFKSVQSPRWTDGINIRFCCGGRYEHSIIIIHFIASLLSSSSALSSSLSPTLFLLEPPQRRSAPTHKQHTPISLSRTPCFASVACLLSLQHQYRPNRSTCVSARTCRTRPSLHNLRTSIQ
jgi:hypothetical protein